MQRGLPILSMDLNSSSDEEEAPTVHPPQLQPPPPPPVQPPPPALATGATRTTNSLKLAEAEEIDPLTLGVPGLKTLIPGDRVEVLWRHGADSIPMLALTAAPIDSRHTARGRAGWERGRVKECLLEMRAGRPVIIYHLAYDDGEEV